MLNRAGFGLGKGLNQDGSNGWAGLTLAAVNQVAIKTLDRPARSRFQSGTRRRRSVCVTAESGQERGCAQVDPVH